MTIPPVIVRELRSESRNRTNYWLRVLGAFAVIVVFALITLNDRSSPATLGPKLFTMIHATILIVVYLFVPAMTADCLAHEKREGTLGLLLLTPLTPRGIVAGKSFVHFLRSLTFFLTALPILCLPILLGGVAWVDIYTAFTFELCAILLALSAGLIASSWGKIWGRTLLLAEILSATLAFAFGILLVFLCIAQVPIIGSGMSRSELFKIELWLVAPAVLLSGVAGPTGGWSQFSTLSPGMLHTWCVIVAESFLFCLGIFLLAMLLAARRVARSRQEEPPSIRQLRWQKFFCAPQMFPSFFNYRMRRALNQNPIGWLQQYSWSARLIKWSWCFSIILIETVLLGTIYFQDMRHAQAYLTLFLLVGVALSASGSFRKERETGALELILVSPLRVGEIIWGRLRGIYSQFVFAIVIILSVYFCTGTFFNGAGQSTTGFLILMSNVVTLPVIGLYFSLKIKNIVLAWLSTCFYALLVPLILWLIEILLHLFQGYAANVSALFFVSFFIQIVLAAFMLRRLYTNLDQRTFVLG
ncbi:MAG: hypothetical protein JWM68_4216 [Verrucomicrobiales bacterium]|nr:hypothetical protein [Verrucomicrobiales bacterium]